MGYDFSDPHDALLHAAERLGLRRRGGVLTGERHGLSVRARFLRPIIGVNESGLEVIISGAALPLGVRFDSLARTSALGPAPARPPGPPLGPSGDAELDLSYRVGGDAADLYACLDPEVRRLMINLAGREVSLSYAEQRLEYRDEFFRPAEAAQLLELVRHLLRLGRALGSADEVDLQVALAERVRADPERGIRHGALAALLDGFSGSATAEAVRAEILLGADVTARIIAAARGGAGGAGVLLSVITGDAPARERASALTALEGLTDGGAPEEGAGTPGVAVADVEALALGLLADRSAEVAAAAAGVLGRLGSLAAVEPLLAVQGVLTSRELESAALHAARVIQERYGGQPGLLSLDHAGYAEGGLSLAKGTGEAGAVSLSRGGAVSYAAEAEAPPGQRTQTLVAPSTEEG